MRSIRSLLPLLLLMPGAPAAAEKVLERGETVLNVGFLLQPMLRAMGDANPDGGVATDPAIRRARLLVSGNLTRAISFFASTESPNIGLGGDWSPQFYVLDAYLAFQLVDELSVDAGLILAPLSHHGLQGAASLNTLDYHLALIRYPRTIGKVFRDVGVQARGLLFDKLLHYRVALLNGVEGAPPAAGQPAATPAVNPSDVPRFTGTLRLNLLGHEPGMFFQGIYFTAEPLLSIGVGGDLQPKALVVGDQVATYAAASVDVFLDYPVAEDQELVAQVAGHHYAQGTGGANSGQGLFAEVGYRFDFVQPVAWVDWFRSEQRSAQAVNWRVGSNFWIEKHRANVKLEAGQNRSGEGSGTKAVTVAYLQAQLYF